MSNFDPLKFAVQIKDEASGRLDEIKRKLYELKDVKVKVTLDGFPDIQKMLKSGFEGFNLQLPDFAKIIEGAKQSASQVRDMTNELKAVKNAEDALLNTTRLRKEAQAELNNLIAQQSNSSMAKKVLDFVSLPKETKDRINKLKGLLSSPEGSLSDTVIGSIKNRLEEERGFLKELGQIPTAEIEKYRSNYRSFAAKILEERRKELSVLDKGASDYADKVWAIKQKYRAAMESFVEANVPLSSPSSIPYSAIGSISKTIGKYEAEYNAAMAKRVAAEQELQSLQSGGASEAMSRAAAEKAVTDATNAHAESVRKLNSLIAEQQNQQHIKADYFNLRNEEDKLNAFFAKYTDKFKRMNYEVKRQFELGSGTSGHTPLLDLFKGQEVHRSYIDGFGIFDKQIIAIGKSAEALGDVFGRTRDQAKEMFRTTSSSEFEHMLEMAKAYRREYGRQNITDSESDKYWRYIISLLEKAVELRKQFEKENPNYVMPSLKKPDVMAAYDADKRIGELKESISKATEIEVNAASELAVAKERLAKIQANEAASAKEIEAARLKVKESEEAEKKATEELAKAKEALAKANKENTSVGSNKWSDVESLNNLITRLKYMKQLTEGLSTEHLVNNTGKMTSYYKQVMELGNAFNSAMADLPKVGVESTKEYIAQIKTLWDQFSQSMSQKKVGKNDFAKSLYEQLDIVQNSYKSLVHMGGEQNFLTEVQNQMNMVSAIISNSIRNLIVQIDKMKETISDDNFTAYKKRIEDTAAAMNKLSEAFIKFQGTVGKDEGMKNFMTGLGEVISKIRFQLNSISEGASNMSGDQMLKNYRRNLDKVEEAMYRLQEARGRMIEAISIGKSSGMDVSGMENFLTFLQKYENRLLKLKNDEAALAANDLGGVFGRNYKALLSNTTDFVKQANDYQAAATKVMNASIDMESAMSRLTGAIQSGNGRLDVKPLRDLYYEINTLYKKVNAQPNATLAAGLLGSDFAQKIGEANRLIAVQADAERNLRRYTAMMEDIIKMEGRIDMAKAISVGLNLPTDQLDAAKKRISDMFDEINKIVTDKTRLGDTQLFGAKQFEYKRMTADTKELAAAQEKLNKETQKAIDKSNAEANKKAAAAVKEAAAETNKWAESQRQAAIQADALTRKVDKWSQIADRGAKLGVDTSELQNAIKIMNIYVQLLNQMSNGVRWSKTTSEIVSAPGFIIGSRDAEAAAKTVEQQSNELERNANSKNKAAKASNELTLQEQRLAAEMEKVSQSAKGQSQVLSDLKSMAQQYLSLYGTQQFLNNIIEIGGQLENQRMSIASILGDAAQANTLFGQIQSLAVKSPFGVVELDQYTKQLSAFGFQYNELYDMTKRLADISAGAGTDVGRLALALGHVRAEGALTGYTLRQFAMNNIPMLQKLSDMLSAREGRLVSTQDIRKRVSNKQIGYEDVISVIKGLTDEGGMFYNMQEAISQSTKSKWKNLKDAMDIMYGKMAESDLVGGGLKDLASFLTDLTKKWERIGAVLITTGSAWGIAKIAAIAYNSALGTNAVQTLKAMKAAQRMDAATLNIAKSYRIATAAENANTTARHSAIITTTQLAISNKKLSAEELSRAVALGKLTKQQAFCAIAQSNLTITQKRYYAEMIRGTMVLSAWQAGILRLKIAMAGLKASFLALAANPMTWLLTFVSAATYLWSKHNEQMERAKELQESINTVGREGVKNIKGFVNSNTGTRIVGTVEDTDDKGKKIKYEADLTDNYEKYKNTRLYLPAFDTLDEASIRSVMDNAEQFIKEYSATPNTMLNDAFADHGGVVNNLRAQYDSLEESLNTLHKAYAIINNDMKEVMDYSLESTGGWFNDDLIENINDYSKAYKEYKDSITDFISDNEKAAQEGLKAALSVKSFGDAVAAANKKLKEKGSPAMSNMQMLQMLLDDSKKFQDAQIAMRNQMGVGTQLGLNKVMMKGGSARLAYKDMEQDLDNAIKSMKDKLAGLGWDFKKLTDAQRQAVAIALAEMVGKATDSTDEVRDRIVALAKEKFGIKLDVEQAEAVAKINEVKKQLEAICNKTWMIEVGITGDIGTDLPKVDPKYKKSLEDIERYGNALKRAGIIGKVGERAPEIVIDKENNLLSTEWNPQHKPISNTSPFSPTDTNLIKAYNKALNDKADSLKWYEAYHMTPPEDSKSKKNGGGSKAWKDEFAKRWDERIRIMKEAYDWYEKWRKEYGKDTAFDKVNTRYQDIFKEWKTDKVLPMNFDVKQIADYAKYVRQIKDDALKRYQAQKNDKSKNNGQEALRVFRQAVSLLTDFDWDEMQRKSEEYASSMKQNISDMSEKWANFKSLLESTGNRELSARLSGLTMQDANNRFQAEQLKRQIQSVMPNIDFSKVYDMDSKAIQNYLSEKLSPKPIDGESDAAYMQRLADYNTKIKGIVESLEELKKLNKDVERSGIEAYKSVMEKAMDYASQLQRIVNKLEEVKANILNNPKLSLDEKYTAVDRATASANLEALKASSGYSRFFNNMMSAPISEMRSMANEIKYRLNEAMKTGAISASDYAKQIAEVNNIMSDMETKDPTKWYNKGLLGGSMDDRMQRKINQGNDMINQGAYDYQKAKAAGDSEGMKAATEKIDSGKSMVASAKNFNMTMTIIEKVINAVDDSIQGAVKGFGYLQEMLGSFGVESDTMSTVGDYLGAIGNMSSHVKSSFAAYKNGDFITAGAEGIGAVTSLISGFNQAHDNRLERQIVKLREEVTRIADNTALIVSLRERELGYDSGDIRRSMASLYSPKGRVLKGFLSGTWFGQGFSSKAQKDMFEYYTRNNQGSGYSQELANLKAERDNYMEQLNKQETKKKKSQSDIEETKKKIAELDEQIYYFTQDLAKELWSIDIKSWAQQISDALATAFENGTSMAEAYRDTVKTILQQLSNKMLQLKFIEPMFTALEESLFGKKNSDGTTTGGVIDPNNPVVSAQRVSAIVADFFGTGGEGEKTMIAAKQFMNTMEKVWNDAGLSMFNDNNSSTLGNGIQGTAEETSNLLAGYVNALRQDVSIMRIIQEQFVSDYWNNYIQQVSGIQGHLSSIDRNVALIYSLINESGALYSLIEGMNTRLERFSNGMESVKIR